MDVLPVPGSGDTAPSNDKPSQFALTYDQIDNVIKEFIQSIDQNAVCGLASRYNDQKPCSVIGQDSGSFNVCFFVRFEDDTTWVVRIPITPVVYNVWDKVQSEATTMRRAPKAVFDELIDIFVQLRELEFSTAGSLMPNPDSELQPIMGGLLSMAANEIQRHGKGAAGLSRKQVEMEVFALESLEEQIPKVINPRYPNGPFVLTHTDLRCGNIIVTEDLHIQGVIDWEFTGTFPPALFTPPSWVTRHDVSSKIGTLFGIICSGFNEALESKSRTSSTCARLRDEWAVLPRLTFPIAQILRQPSNLFRVYYPTIFSQLFEGNEDQVVPELFRRGDKHGLALEAERRMAESQHYTEYLESHGLLVVKEQSQETKDLLAKLRQVLGKETVE